MSYWSKDWTCSDCNCKALSKNKKCPDCGKSRPYPRACEAGPIDTTQELIEAAEAIGRQNYTWKYFPNRDCYGISLDEFTHVNKEAVIDRAEPVRDQREQSGLFGSEASNKPVESENIEKLTGKISEFH